MEEREYKGKKKTEKKDQKKKIKKNNKKREKERKKKGGKKGKKDVSSLTSIPWQTPMTDQEIESPRPKTIQQSEI